jgi:hypothetical protein
MWMNHPDTTTNITRNMPPQKGIIQILENFKIIIKTKPEITTITGSLSGRLQKQFVRLTRHVCPLRLTADGHSPRQLSITRRPTARRDVPIITTTTRTLIRRK